MPDNQGLSHLSDHFLIVAVVLYSLAVVAFAADFAFGRRGTAVPRAEAGVPDLVPAGVAAGAGTAGSGATASGATQSSATQSSATQSSAAHSGVTESGATQSVAAQSAQSHDAGSADIPGADPGRPWPAAPWPVTAAREVSPRPR